MVSHPLANLNGALFLTVEALIKQNKKKFCLPSSDTRRRNNRVEQVLNWKTKDPLADFKQAQPQLHKELTSEISVSVIKFMMCEFNDGLFDADIALLYLICSAFRSAVDSYYK